MHSFRYHRLKINYKQLIRIVGFNTGKQCPWIAIWLPALLVEGIPQAPMNAEFYSAAARPLDAFSQAKNSPEYEF